MITPAPHEDRHIEVNGINLHYLDYGTAGKPPMLCLHGGAVTAHWFDFVAGGFTAEYHVRALDQRGHGDSGRANPPSYRYDEYASDAEEVMKKLGMEDVVLVGHSMGGLVSLTHEALYPGRVQALVVVDSTLRSTPDRVSNLHQIGNREGSSYATNEEFIERFKVRPEGTQAAPEIIRYLAERGGRQDENGRWRHKFDRNVYSKRELIEIPPLWDRVKIPVLLVKGGLSDRVTPEIIADIKSRAPQVELAEVPGSEHHVTLDNPPDFVAAVKRFLAKL
ncbi:MAG TPA: alpha/beta hydrolase [Burkholderiales bacterium]|nr:alpha/beta hydrolase [Burkholderiales bacterium]